MRRQARSGPPLSALAQPELPSGHVPRDRALRESLIWIAHRTEAAGPEAIPLDLSTESGRQAWTDLLRACHWIYDNAADPIDERTVPDAAAATTAD